MGEVDEFNALALGSKFLVSGFWFLVSSFWFLVSGCRPLSRFPRMGERLLGLRLCLGQKSCILLLATCYFHCQLSISTDALIFYLE